MSDAWLIKTDSTGDELWNKTWGRSACDSFQSGQQTSDGGYVLAGWGRWPPSWDTDFWFIKTDANGNELLNKRYGSTSDDTGYFVQQTSDNGYILTGITQSYGAGNWDVWLVKTDALGNEEWNKTYGGEDAGDYEVYFLLVTSDEGYILAGNTNRYTLGYTNMWIGKVDEHGVEEWNQTFGEPSFNPSLPSLDGAHSVVETPDGGYLVVGQTVDDMGRSLDLWLIKIDEYGNMQWNQKYGGTYTIDIGHSVIETADGGYAIAGCTASYGAGGYDFWLIKIDGYGRVP